MDSFAKFFNIAKERSTPNTRVHHQNLLRSTNRKHLNQVARKYGVDGQKADPIIDNIVKYKKHGTWPILPTSAKKLLKTYGIQHLPEKNYSKAIKQTGIFINYDANKDKFTLSRQK